MRILALSSLLLICSAPAFAGTSATNSYSTEVGHTERHSQGSSSGSYLKIQDNSSVSLKQEFFMPAGTTGYVNYNSNGQVSIMGGSPSCVGNQSMSARVDPAAIQGCSSQREHVVIQGTSHDSYTESYKGTTTGYSHTQSVDSF